MAEQCGQGGPGALAGLSTGQFGNPTASGLVMHKI